MPLGAARAVLLGGDVGYTHHVVVGDWTFFGRDSWGFDNFWQSPAEGSRSPTTFEGFSIKGLYFSDELGTPNWNFYLNGVHSKTAYHSIWPEGLAAPLLFADSTRDTASGVTFWIWETANYGGWDGLVGSTLGVQLVA